MYYYFFTPLICLLNPHIYSQASCWPRPAGWTTSVGVHIVMIMNTGCIYAIAPSTDNTRVQWTTRLQALIKLTTEKETRRWIYVCFASGAPCCVCTVSSGWRGHWYGSQKLCGGFFGPPATMPNLVLILGAWWSCLFWWGRAECRGMLCIGHRDAVFRTHTHSHKLTHTLTQADTQIPAAVSKVRGWGWWQAGK